VKALERMEILRPHQIVHPDLVTEGMNRLAQAMIAMTAAVPAPPPAPPAVRKPKKPAKTPPPAPAEVNLELAGFVPTASAPAVLDAEVLNVAAAQSAMPFVPESRAVNPEEPEIPALDDPIEIPEPPPGTVKVPSPRRKAYRTLSLLRRFAEGWDRLRPILGDPGEQLTTPVRIFAFLEASRDLRAVLNEASDLDSSFRMNAGAMTLRVIHDPAKLTLLRDMVPSQRRILARDWAVAKAELEVHRRVFRRATRQSRRSAGISRAAKGLQRFWKAYPEIILLVTLSLALIVALSRGLNRS
jgi:hypothetical protein